MIKNALCLLLILGFSHQYAIAQIKGPSRPVNLLVKALTNSSLELEWVDNSNDETIFYIARSLSPLMQVSVIDSVPANNNNHIVTNLNSGTYYYFTVRARNANGYSAYSNIALGMTEVSAPAAPSGLRVLEMNASFVQLHWNDNSYNETGFIIQRADSINGTYKRLVNVDGGITNYTDHTVIPGNDYRYRLVAVNTAGYSAFSGEVHVKTLYPAPLQPKDLHAVTLDHHQIRLDWQYGSGDIDRFYIVRRYDTGYAYMLIDSVPGNVLVYTDKNLLYDTKYLYRVQAYKEHAAYGGFTSDADATTFPSAPVPPLPPDSLHSIIIGSDHITFQWRDNADNDRKFYIEQQSDNGFILIDSTAANTTTYTHAGLRENTPCAYRVRAWNPYGYSGYSNVLERVTLVDLHTPVALFTQQLSTYRFQLKWTDNNDGETGYIIQRSVVANDRFESIDSVAGNIDTYADSLPGKGIFYYRIIAEKNNRYSDPGNIAVAVNITSGLGSVSGDQEIDLYPVPASHTLYIRSEKDIAVASLFNRMGEEVVKIIPGLLQSGIYDMQVEHLPASGYIIKLVFTDGSMAVKQFVKH